MDNATREALRIVAEVLANARQHALLSIGASGSGEDVTILRHHENLLASLVEGICDRADLEQVVNRVEYTAEVTVR